MTFFTMETFNLFLLIELAPVGTAWTLSVYGWDAAAVRDAQDLVPPHEGLQRSKGRSAGCSTPVPDREIPQDVQNKVHPGKGPFCAPSLG